MNEILKFGTPGRLCPCHNCGGDPAQFSDEERNAQKQVRAEINLHRETARKALRDLNRALKHGKHDDQIREALRHQARIAQLDHGGWDIEIKAWANECPDCHRVTEYRAGPSHKFRFGYSGPIAESTSCTDCRANKERERLLAEHVRLSKMSSEEIEAERAGRARAETIITPELVEAEIKKAEAAGGPTPADSARILRLMNRMGQKLGPNL